MRWLCLTGALALFAAGIPALLRTDAALKDQRLGRATREAMRFVLALAAGCVLLVLAVRAR